MASYKEAGRMDSYRVATKNVKVVRAEKPRRKEFDDQADYRAEVEYDEHHVPLDELFRRYGTDPHKGLSDDQAGQFLEAEGQNILTPPQRTSECLKLCRSFFGGFSMLLIIGALLCYIAYIIQWWTYEFPPLENLYLGIALTVAIIVTGLFTYYHESRNNRVMDMFQRMIPQQTYVVRDGIKKPIRSEDLVVGDIVYIESGDRIPADVRILTAQAFKVDNSTLSGESEPQTRSPEYTNENALETRNLAFFGTNAIEGSATGLVIRTGDITYMGRISRIVAAMDARDTPMGREISRLLHVLTTIAIIMGVIFFIITFALQYYWLDALIFSIGLIIANLPEGLFAIVTVCLTLTAKRMAKKNCLVKNLQAIEALGATSTICSDKTGTLTQNSMSVSHLWFDSRIHVGHSSQDERETKFDIDAAGFRALTRCAVLCNRAEFRDDQENANKPLWTRDCTGNASEAALLRFYEEHVGGSTNYRYNNPKVAEVPFTPVNKFQLSIHTTEDGDERFLLEIKGAPEVVLQRCTTIFVDGRELPLTGDWHDVFMDAYHDMGSNGERVLGFADFRLPRRDFPRNYRFMVDEIENLSQFNFPMNGFRFLGLIAMHDPPRPSVPEAVKKCRSAGIKVIMITGDHPITAKAIAKQVGIISEGSETVEDIALRLRVPVEQVNKWDAKAAVVHGSELKGMSVNDLDDILSHYEEIVIARTSPQQKLIIVEGCQRQGAIVAVTGDGVNDSPALKQADIGIAMGISGSDVSKQAADMILLDDDFASIVTGVEEGRLIFDNLKKTIAYAITSNVPEVAPFFMFLVTDIPFALGMITILCIDLGTDLYPAVSLAYEEPESDIMKRKPRDPDADRLVNRMLISLAYGQIGMIQASAGFFAFFVALAENGFWPSRLVGIRKFWDSHGIHDLQDSYGQEWSYDQRKDLERTGFAAFFFAIVVVQWANLLICRTRRLSMFQQRFRNWHILGALAFETGLAILIIFVPYVNRVLSCQQLMFLWMLPAVPYAIAIVVYDEVRKLLIRKNPGGWLEQETYY